MIICDIETTGTNPRVHSIVSIGAIDLNNPSKQFYAECKPFSGAKIEDEALAVNGYNREELVNKPKNDEEIVKEFLEWRSDIEDQTFAALHPTFDTGFIQATCERCGIEYPYAKRTIDLHTLVYAHMIRSGIEIPMRNHHSNIASDGIMQYVGIPAEPKPHIAINGAVWEAEAFSRIVFNRKLLPQFEQYPIPWIS